MDRDATAASPIIFGLGSLPLERSVSKLFTVGSTGSKISERSEFTHETVSAMFRYEPEK